MTGTSSIAIPESARRLFEGSETATVITVNPDGTPQASMIWVALEGNDIMFAADTSYQKIRNLRRNPIAVIVVNDDEVTARGLRHHIVVRGRASVTGPGIPDEYEAFISGTVARYFPGHPAPRRGLEDGVIVRITPERIRGIGPWA